MASTKSPSSTRSLPTRPQHVSLAKRLLFPALPTDELPPLLATPVPAELNAELYEFIALALRAFVNPWWTKITRYDKEFLPHVTHILTHVVRDLEARLLTIDFTTLLCRDIPLIVSQHYRDFRTAKGKISTSYAAGGSLSLPQLFHQLQPHIAVSPDGQLNQIYYRQVVEHILTSCMPAEDSEPECERSIVREILLKIITQDIIPKVTQPWFIEKMIVDQLGPPPAPALKVTEAAPPSNPFSFHSLVILFLSAVQSISGAALASIQAYKQAVHTIKLVNQSPLSASENPVSTEKPPSPTTQLPPPTLSRASSNASYVSFTPSRFREPSIPTNSHDPIPPNDSCVYAPLQLATEIFTLKDRFASNIVINTVQMIAAFFIGFLIKFIPFTISRSLSPDLVLNVVRIGKRSMFPTGYPQPAPPDPTPQEQAAIHAKLLAWRPSGGASHVVPVLFGEDVSSTIQAAIEPLSEQACNAHLIVILLDRIIMALYPDLVSSPMP